MRCVIWPFYSQQDKRTGEFLLDTCGATKQLSWLARKLEEELGWDVAAVVPKGCNSRSPFLRSIGVPIPADNPRQRLHWDTEHIERTLRGVDVALLNHELLAIPVRRLFPKLKIVQMCSVMPDDTLFREAWASSHLVVAQSHTARQYIENSGTRNVTVWPLAFDAGEGTVTVADRDIDVLFVQRCSVTNYTKHLEFLEAVKLTPDLRVAFTDVTGYLRKERPGLLYSEPVTYRYFLARSKVAVALNDNLAGGLSFREACRAGCTPLVLDAECYREVVGDDYPHRARSLSPAPLAAAVYRALADPRTVDVSSMSYQASWPRVKADLEKLTGN